VRRGDPAAQVVLGGLAGNVGFLRALLVLLCSLPSICHDTAE